MSESSELLDKLVEHETFRDFEEIENYVKRLTDELKMPCRIGDCRTVENYNASLKNVENYLNPEIRYKHVKFICSHYGVHRSRSKGKRNPQVVRACDCPFYFKVAYQRLTSEFRITGVCRQHENHPMDESTINTFRVKQRLPVEIVNFIENATAAGILPKRIRQRALLQFGKDLPLKFIQNTRQKIIGLPKDEWNTTAEMLIAYANKAKSHSIEILRDDLYVITHIFVQLAVQKEMYKNFGQLLQYDGTLSTNKFAMPLYTLLVEDNYGVGQPVCYCFMREETSESIKKTLQLFSECNDISVTETVVTDKGCAEISAFAEIFPQATQLLCQHHGLLAAEKRIITADLGDDLSEEILQRFKQALHAHSIEELEDAAGYLTKLEHDNLGDYFETCWFKSPELWCDVHRTHIFTKGNNTTKRLDRFHSTIRTVAGQKKSRFQDFIQILLDILRNQKEVDTTIKINTHTIPEFLKDFAMQVTPYAYQLVNAQMKLKTSGYSVIRTEIGIFITSESQIYEIENDLTECSCSFFASYRLPCCHILFAVEKYRLVLPVENYEQCWNKDKSADGVNENEDDGTGSDVSPIKVVNSSDPRKVLTKEDKWNTGNQLAKLWCNAIQDLPPSAFDSQINLMKKMIDIAKANQVIVFGMEDKSPVKERLTNNTNTTPKSPAAIENTPNSRKENAGNVKASCTILTPGRKRDASKASLVASEDSFQVEKLQASLPINSKSPSKKRKPSRISSVQISSPPGNSAEEEDWESSVLYLNKTPKPKTYLREKKSHD